MSETDIYEQLGILQGRMESMAVQLAEVLDHCRRLDCSGHEARLRILEETPRRRRPSEGVQRLQEGTLDVIKSSRFWLALVIMIGAFVMACLKIVTGTEAITVSAGVLAGFGVAKAGGNGNGAAKLIPLLLAASLLSGCLTVGSVMHKAQVGVEAADKLALDAWGRKCLEEATRCGPVGADKCTAWVVCDTNRQRYVAAVNALLGSLATVNRCVFDLGIADKRIKE